MKFSDIKKIPQCYYNVDVSWKYLESTLKDFKEDAGLDLNPEFQRGHVWTENQQIEYVEYRLRGGSSGEQIYFNAPNWPESDHGMVIVDGKQRLQAVRLFLADKIKMYGHYYSEYEDNLRALKGASFKFSVAPLTNQYEVLEWYLALNGGGTPHSEEELSRVRLILEKERKQ